MSRPILSLRSEMFSAATLPVSAGWLLADCMEYRGKQDFWIRQKPAIVEALRQEAMVFSVESSNRIEGVTVSTERLRPLVLGNAKPRDRDEEEVAGYRKALEWIFAGKSRLPLASKTLLGLHAMSHAGSGDAGQFKARDNEIIEIKPSGERVVRFRPASARETPAAVEMLGKSFADVTDGGTVPPLLLTATAILDFLCIHPFRDGNGRVSRLLTNMLLREQGFIICRFVSLERLVEESKEDYYRVLAECSAGWAEGSNKILPWWNYFLTILRRAYVEFAEKVEKADDSSAKSELVRRTVLGMARCFSLSNVAALVPDASESLVKKVLAAMREENLLKLEGRGRGARWLLKSR